MSLPFLRPDLAEFAAYTPHPGSADDLLPAQVDHLDTNECPYDLPEALKEKLAWLAHHEILTNRYPGGDHLALRAAIATYVNESAQLPNAPFTGDYISVGSGSDELIRSLLIATCAAGQGSILVANPTFSMYVILARTLGIPVIEVDRDADSFEVDLSAAQQAVEQKSMPPVRVVFMVHPNSPTANALTAAELRWLQQLPQDILVVVDEAYFEFCQQTTVAEILQRPNWVVMHTFSKAFRLAAHRVGYAVANPSLIAALEKVRLPYNLPSLSQSAAQLVLEHRHDLLKAIPLILQQRQTLEAALQAQTPLRLWPSAANFIYARPPVTAEPLAAELNRIFRYLKTQGTLVRQTGDGFRITVGTPEENQRTVSRIQAAFEA
ncbi:histidinol-phosphate transaminase [Pseudanabaena sp. FACHB-2040]|uniref:histidinol-phosphate transaminase n=1 Tax=Pseudanabaena sp. FACHB-2040 TaxID=2692859 RepID=UPI0016864440|nr:histidinol-phosphate transaminase [Pseudanabaena sp. FACHB-2040]MBD2259226.1 histidinol-phosphate transaminase [Pseudanabaena sp. FACHB-2040]